jgi:hypothetical protein
MALPKGLIKQATGTVSPRLKEEAPAATAIDPFVREEDDFTPTQATTPTRNIRATTTLFSDSEPPPQHVSDTKPEDIRDQKIPHRTSKKRVHYYIHADLIEFVEDAWRDYRRADGTRLYCASDYIGELLKLARDRTKTA